VTLQILGRAKKVVAGGVAVIRVGCSTEVEVKERRTASIVRLERSGTIASYKTVTAGGATPALPAVVIV
jgi:hypothetical protein